MALSTSCSLDPRAPSTASKPAFAAVNAACDWVFTIQTVSRSPQARAMLAAVTSFGINNCTGVGGVFRMDRAWAHDWVSSFLP